MCGEESGLCFSTSTLRTEERKPSPCARDPSRLGQGGRWALSCGKEGLPSEGGITYWLGSSATASALSCWAILFFSSFSTSFLIGSCKLLIVIMGKKTKAKETSVKNTTATGPSHQTLNETFREVTLNQWSQQEWNLMFLDSSKKYELVKESCFVTRFMFSLLW